MNEIAPIDAAARPDTLGGMPYGFGHIYLRGSVYWIKYSQDGRAHYESSESEKISDAKRLLKKRLAAADNGAICPQNVTVGRLLDDCLAYYERYRKSADTFAKSYIGKLQRHWGRHRASQVTTAQLERYQQKRLAEDMAPATINREMALLRRAFRLGMRTTPPLVLNCPVFPMLPEADARRGFIDADQFRALLAALPDELHALVTVAYYTGARRGELLALTWDHVDLEAAQIVLDPGATKSGRGRLLPLGASTVKALRRQLAITPANCPWVFHRSGRKLRDFRAAWDTATTAAGLTGLLFHDLRRSAVRNMVRGGTPERVAMAISGHLTRSVFDRYNITDGDDLRRAADATEQYLSGEKTVTKLVTVAPQKSQKKRKSA